VDGLAQLLYQFAQTRCHGSLQERRPAPAKSAGSCMGFIDLTSVAVQKQPESGSKLCKTAQ
jgi:hypothetical protein